MSVPRRLLPPRCLCAHGNCLLLHVAAQRRRCWKEGGGGEACVNMNLVSYMLRSAPCSAERGKCWRRSRRGTRRSRRPWMSM